MASAPRSTRPKTKPHQLLSILLYAPAPWVRRRVDLPSGVIRVDAVPARLREALHTTRTRLREYFQFLELRGLAHSVEYSAGRVSLVVPLPGDHPVIHVRDFAPGHRVAEAGRDPRLAYGDD